MPKKTTPSVTLFSREELFYEKIRIESTSVFVYLINGIKLQGSVVAADAEVIALSNGEHVQMIYKHAISTVVAVAPAVQRSGLDRRFNLRRNKEGDFFQKSSSIESNATMEEDDSAWNSIANSSASEEFDAENVESAIYADIILQKKSSVIFLMNGIKLIGHLQINDPKVIFVHTEDGKKLMVYKHAVSTLADASAYRNASADISSDRTSFGNTTRNALQRNSSGFQRNTRYDDKDVFDLPEDL